MWPNPHLPVVFENLSRLFREAGMVLRRTMVLGKQLGKTLF